MWGIKQSFRTRLPDFSIVLGLTIINLFPWIPFIQKGVSGSWISFPSFGQDQMHYVARAFSIWKGKHPSEAFVPRETELTDGLGNYAELALFIPSKFPVFDNLNFASYFYILVCFSSLVALAASYFFFKFLTNSRSDACVITIVFIYFSQSLDLNGINFPTMPIFNRWPTPMLHYLGLFILLRALIDKSFGYRKVIASISLAFGFYLYVYTWQVMIAIIFSALLTNLINRDFREIKELAIILFAGVALGFPTILGIANLLIEDRSDGLLEFAFRQENSRTVIIDKMGILLAIIALVAFTLRHRMPSKVSYLFYLLAITAFVVSNQQIVTGKILQPGHFHWYFVAPAMFSCLTILLLSLFKNGNLKIAMTISLIFILGFNQLHSLGISRIESQAQSSSALTSQQVAALRGVVFTQDSAVLDQLATGYSGDLYWHSFGIYYGGSRDIANEFVAFSSVWMGDESPIRLKPLGINCLTFETDPCSTSRMLLGSESDVGWWKYLENGSPVEDSLYSQGSSLSHELRAAGNSPAEYFSRVIDRRNIQTIITGGPLSVDQRILLGNRWTLISKNAKFWIYSQINS